MTLAGVDKECSSVHLDQMKSLLRCQRQVFDMLHAAVCMNAAGNAATMTPDKPHQPEQHHQKHDDYDDLFERNNGLYRHDEAP